MIGWIVAGVLAVLVVVFFAAVDDLRVAGRYKADVGGAADTERLDAIDNLGLCIVGNQERVAGQWVTVWTCIRGDRRYTGPSIRDVINQAINEAEIEGAL